MSETTPTPNNNPGANGFTPSAEQADQRKQAFTNLTNFKRGQRIKKGGAALAGVVLAVAGTALTSSASGSFPQLIENGTCPMVGGKADGTAEKPIDIQYNPLKNRFIAPGDEDIDAAATAEVFLSDPPATVGTTHILDAEKAASVTAYIVDIKSGGAETCNCQTPDKQWWDTHIYLSPTPPIKGTTLGKDCFIAEITPRTRLAGNPGDVSLTTEDLMKKYSFGTKVQITGWEFYDIDHEQSSANTVHSSHAHDWRATCWEIHPVTEIKIVQ